MLVVSVIINIALLLQVNSAHIREHTRIINGNAADIDEIPYQISVQVNGAHGCGGSIISKNLVLTAAHCFGGVTPENMHLLSVVAGTVDLTNLEDTASTHDLSEILIHEEYDEIHDWNNDIALLKVNPPFQFSEHIAPALLPSKGEVYKDDTSVVVSGFGKTESEGGLKSSSKLMKAEVRIVDQDFCVANFTSYKIRPTNICANNYSEKRGFCIGDSGGPLSIDGKVIGIVSWSFNYGCAPVKNPQVYTRVSSYIDWITKNMDQ